MCIRSLATPMTPPLTRRQLLGAGGAALATLTGCQALDGESETVTPAAVPQGRVGPTLELRHAGAGGSGPLARAVGGLAEAFRTERPDVRIVEQRASDSRSADRSLVSYGRLGAALLSGSDRELSRLTEVWNDSSRWFPSGLLRVCYRDWNVVAIPQSVHQLNCLFYNPTTLAEAGVKPDSYGTVADLQAAPGPLAERVETLFAQPLRSGRDRLALWESLLGGRLIGQRQYDQLVAGYVAPNGPTVERATRDYAAALSMLPDDADSMTPQAALDGVLDGTVGFAHLPSWMVAALVEADTEYGTDWAVTSMFSSPRVVVVVPEGFAVPSSTVELALPRSFVRFALEVDPHRAFGAARGAVPARTDVAGSVDDRHPAYRELWSTYAEATIHAPSIADGVAVRPSIQRRLAGALADFEAHGSVEETAATLLAAFDETELF